jgi:lipooligosaccharide transport system permease protein
MFRSDMGVGPGDTGPDPGDTGAGPGDTGAGPGDAGADPGAESGAPTDAIDVARTATGSFAVIAAVLWREWAVFRRVWFSTAFGSVAEPVILFVAFGFGFGALVAEVAGLSYLDFIATGAVAIGVLFSSIFPALINGYFRRKEQQLYDGLLAAPLAIGELVTGEALWNALRATAVAIVTVGVAFAFGVRPAPTVVLTPLITVAAGFGFAAAGAAFGAVLRSTHGFDMIIVGVIVPMYVVAGTFFPIDGLPRILAAIAVVNPLYHVVELLRVVTFATPATSMILVHVAVIVVFDVLAWFAAVRLLRRALID